MYLPLLADLRRSRHSRRESAGDAGGVGAARAAAGTKKDRTLGLDGERGERV